MSVVFDASTVECINVFVSLNSGGVKKTEANARPHWLRYQSRFVGGLKAVEPSLPKYTEVMNLTSYQILDLPCGGKLTVNPGQS